MISSLKKVFIILLPITLFYITACKQEKSFQFIPEKVTNFSATDVHGDSVSYQDLKGKITLVYFSASWCPACQMDAPKLKRLYKEYAPKGLRILLIDVDNSPADMIKYQAVAKYPYPILFQNKNVLEYFGNPMAVPSYFLINAKNNIFWRHIGMLQETEFIQELDSTLVTEKP